MKRTTKGVGVLGMVLLLLAVSLGNALAEQSDEFYQESQVAEKMLLGWRSSPGRHRRLLQVFRWRSRRAADSPPALGGE